jgi:hypothetical protein
MNFEQAKAKALALWEAHADAAAVLAVFPKGAMGLTPDAVKASPEWQAAYRIERAAFAELRTFNAMYVKRFKKEIYAARAAERMAKAQKELDS